MSRERMNKRFTLNVENEDASLFCGQTNKLATGALEGHHQTSGPQAAWNLTHVYNMHSKLVSAVRTRCQRFNSFTKVGNAGGVDLNSTAAARRSVKIAVRVHGDGPRYGSQHI